MAMLVSHFSTDTVPSREAIQAIIEIFYRQQRKQARLGYIFPAAFERQFYENRLAA